MNKSAAEFGASDSERKARRRITVTLLLGAALTIFSFSQLLILLGVVGAREQALPPILAFATNCAPPPIVWPSIRLRPNDEPYFDATIRFSGTKPQKPCEILMMSRGLLDVKAVEGFRRNNSEDPLVPSEMVPLLKTQNSKVMSRFSERLAPFGAMPDKAHSLRFEPGMWTNVNFVFEMEGAIAKKAPWELSAKVDVMWLPWDGGWSGSGGEELLFADLVVPLPLQLLNQPEGKLDEVSPREPTYHFERRTDYQVNADYIDGDRNNTEQVKLIAFSTLFGAGVSAILEGVLALGILGVRLAEQRYVRGSMLAAEISQQSQELENEFGAIVDQNIDEDLKDSPDDSRPRS